MRERLKCSHIFEPDHNNKNFERIKEWVEMSDLSITDLMAIICTKFAQLIQVRSNTITRLINTVQIYGERYNFIIAKVGNNDKKDNY